MKKVVVVLICVSSIFYSNVCAEQKASYAIEGDIYNKTDVFANDIENVMGDTSFDDIIERSKEVVEKHNDNPIVKLFKKLTELIFEFLNKVLQKASESILEMINSHEKFKINYKN